MRKKFVILCLGTVAFVGGVILFHQSNASFYFKGAELKETILATGAWAPVAYICVYTVAAVLFVPSSPLTVLGGALFGPLYGTIYTIVGATLGAVCAFVITRLLGQSFFLKGTGSITSQLHVYNEKIARHGFLTVLFLRIVPLFPFNGLNFGLGLTKVSFHDYVLGTFFGIIPGTFAYVYFGNSLGTLDPLKIVSALILITALSLFGKYMIKRYTKAAGTL